MGHTKEIQTEVVVIPKTTYYKNKSTSVSWSHIVFCYYKS